MQFKAYYPRQFLCHLSPVGRLTLPNRPVAQPLFQLVLNYPEFSMLRTSYLSHLGSSNSLASLGVTAT